MARRYEGQVEIIGVPSSDTLENMRAFVERHGLGATRQAVDMDREVWGTFDIPGQPAWAFVTADGDVSTHIGPLFGDDLVTALQGLLDG